MLKLRSFFWSDREKFFLKLLLALMIVGCQTVSQERESLSLPVVWQPLFSSCVPSEEEAFLEIERDGARLFSGQLVWSFVMSGESSLQLNSPLGDSIIDMRINQGRWLNLSQEQLRVTETDKGLFNIDGYDVPLKPSELGCILAGTWPASWLRWFRVTQDQRDLFTMEGTDGQRSVKIELVGGLSSDGLYSSKGASCAFFAWGGFLGFFQRHAKLCREVSRSGVQLKLSGISNYLVNWTINNGQ